MRAFLSAVLFCVILIIADISWAPMQKVRSGIDLILTPVHWLADLPIKVYLELSTNLVSRNQLQLENIKLKTQLLFLQQKHQQINALNKENDDLRLLLQGSKKLSHSVRLTEVVGVNPDPFQHQLILNQGSAQQLKLGQPVLDANGVMGQVVELSPYASRLMLLTDARHAIPVVNNRTGLKGVAVGSGNRKLLELHYIPKDADIKLGDLLVSSGFGDVFPSGYPVAVVTAISPPLGTDTILNIQLRPLAKLHKSRYLLLVENNEQ